MNERKESEYVTKYTVENVLLTWIEGEKDFFEESNKEFCNEIYERLVKRKIIIEEGDKCKLYMPLLKFMFLKKRGVMDKDALEYVD